MILILHLNDFIAGGQQDMTSGGNVNFCLKGLLIKVSTSSIYVKTVNFSLVLTCSTVDFQGVVSETH